MAFLWFAAGLTLGSAIVGLWMRTRIAQVEAARQASEAAAAKLGETFQSLADAALRSNQSAFLDAARSTLETVRAEMTGDLAQKQTAIAGLVEPLSNSLGKLETQVRELDRERQKIFGSLGEQIQALAKETCTLSTALRSPQARGRWGEVTLRRVAEISGMVGRCDFFEQDTRETSLGRIRPDMVVRLPGARSIVVDAKVPLTAYLEAVTAAEEPLRRAALQRHAQQVSEHVKQLSSKQYWAQFQPTPEMVVLFLPGDHFLSAALEVKPELVEESVERRVLIATPVTLIAVLKGIAYGWNQAQLAENAIEIRELACQLHERLQTVWQHYADTGRQLEKTVTSYNKSVGSWDTRLMPAVRRMQELGVKPDAAEPDLEPVDVLPRMPRQLVMTEATYSQLRT
ncbi:MAG: DNA recombination protein RmuC [Bryobacteraceae bacterium]|jgi:DNA recombination protein RmuC